MRSMFGVFVMGEIAACLAAGVVVLFSEGLTIEAPYLLGILAGAGTVIAMLFKLLMAAKDAQIKEVEAQKKTYEEIACEAVRSAAETTNYYRQKEGKAPLLLPVPVIPEGSSPPSNKQLENAKSATLRASMVVIKRVTSQESRGEPGHGKPSE